MKNIIYLLIILQLKNIYISQLTLVASPENITEVLPRLGISNILQFTNGTYFISSSIKIYKNLIIPDDTIVEISSTSNECIFTILRGGFTLKGKLILKNSNCGIDIRGGGNTIDGIKIYNMKTNGIIINNYYPDIKIINTEIISSGEIGIKVFNSGNFNAVSNKIYNCKIGIYLSGKPSNLIDRNEIYNSTDALYLNGVHSNFYQTKITNNLIVNTENAITYKNEVEQQYSYYSNLFIIGNTIFKPKKYFLNFQNCDFYSNGNKIINNFIYVPNENFITINNFKIWEFSNNFYYNIDNISSNISNQSRCFNGDLNDIFSNYKTSCNYSTDIGDIAPECFKPNKWNKGNESLYNGGRVYNNNGPLTSYDFNNNPRSNISPTIGAFETTEFDSSIEIKVNYCIYDEETKINMYGKSLKKYFGSIFVEFAKETDCLWKYKFTEIPEYIEYKFIVVEKKSILAFGSKKKLNKTEICNLNAEEDGKYSQGSYFIDRKKNIYSLVCSFKDKVN